MPVRPPIPFPQALPAPMPAPPMPVVPPMAFYQVPPAPMPAPPVAPPVAPPQFFGQAYLPGGWALMPNYFLSPAQPYLISYPPGPWPPYQEYYVGQQGHVDEDSEMAKPNKFTGWDPLKLHPFIISFIMAFDSRPHK